MSKKHEVSWSNKTCKMSINKREEEEEEEDERERGKRRILMYINIIIRSNMLFGVHSTTIATIIAFICRIKISKY